MDNIDKMIEQVAEGAHPRSVLFEGDDSRMMNQSAAKQVSEMIEGAKDLVEGAVGIIEAEMADNHVESTDMMETMDAMKSMSENMDNIKKSVEAYGGLNGGEEDPKNNMGEQENGEPTNGDGNGEDPTNGPEGVEEPESIIVSIDGIEDEEAFKAELNDLIARFGGVSSSEEENKYEGDGKNGEEDEDNMMMDKKKKVIAKVLKERSKGLAYLIDKAKGTQLTGEKKKDPDTK